MPFHIDGSLYPDMSPPQTLSTIEEQVDFLARLCAAWDFGILPASETIDEVRRAEWSEAVDACRFLTSSTYHLLRRWHGLAPLEYIGKEWRYILDDPCLSCI